MSKTVDTRVQLKHDTQTNWDKATNFIPLQSEIIVYDPEEDLPLYRFKIGDGTTPVTDLPFVIDTPLVVYFEHLADGTYTTTAYSEEIMTAFAQNRMIVGALDGSIVYLEGFTAGLPTFFFPEINTINGVKLYVTDNSVIAVVIDISEDLDNKVDKIDGYGLSSNDYTNEDKATVAESASRIIGFASTAGTNAAYTATIDGATLTPGTMIALRFNVANTANATLDVNSLGAKPIYHKGAAITASKLPINAITLLIYDTTQISTGAWHAIYSHDTNTTYNNAILGQGYGTCTTAEATTEKAVALSGYSLTKGGILSIKFTYAVPANATMNINNQGAKAIYNRGVAITAGVIQAEDTATFIYDGTQYQLIAIDRQGGDTSNLVQKTGDTMTGDLTIQGQLYPALHIQPLENDTSNSAVFEGNFAGGVSMAAYEDATGNNRRMLEVRNRNWASDADNALLMRTFTDGNIVEQRVYWEGQSTPIPMSQLDIPTTTSVTSGSTDLVTAGAVYDAVDSKQATITGGATTITSNNLTVNRALVSNSSGKVAVSAVTSTELGYLDGVTSAIQTQLDAKADKALSGITAGTNISVTPNSDGNGVTIASTPTNAAMGQGYGTCSTAAATAEKVVTLSNYVLSTGGIVSVLFTNAIPANATLNINSTGAKSIYYQNAAIVADVITAGTTVTFIYDGTKYHVIAMDKGGGGGANITYGTEDLVAGESPLAEGEVYFVYE